MDDEPASNVVSFDAARVSRYVDQALHGFMMDKADSDYQRGFLGALLVIRHEALGNAGTDDARIAALEIQSRGGSA